jgi:hypothetical protein
MSAPDKPDDDGGFLGRWSRRKLQPADRTGLEAPAGAPQPEVPANPAEPDERSRDPETGELIDEDLVSRLPKIAELEAGGDLSGFMRQGVPEALRREALRTMWLNDPMIRNFVSPALDYAYDYNLPGGAPGSGPLTELDLAQARDFLANVFSTPGEMSGEMSGDGLPAPVSGHRDNESQDGGSAQPSAVRLTDVAAQHGQMPDETAASSDVAQETALTTELPQSGDAPVVRRSIKLSDERPPAAPQRRRGGGAAPV